ncbi:CPBP family intramembrane glutamic endopeptidase [Kaarinaea lacus]
MISWNATIAMQWACFGFLTIAIVSLWRPFSIRLYYRLELWQALSGAALFCGWLGNLLTAVGILWVIALWLTAASVTQWQNKPIWRALSLTMFVVLALAFGFHILPGFSLLTVVAPVQLSPEALPYSLRFSLEKPLVGLFILAYWQSLAASGKDWTTLIVKTVPIAVLTIFAVIILSLLLNYVSIDFKWPAFLGFWLWGNLFFTCMAEEAFFRGLIQHRLQQSLEGQSYAAPVSIVVAALLFGIAHFGGGWQYVLLSMVAGIGYGFVYHKTQRIESSIMLHFMMNLTHILFFTYPAKA